MLNRLKMLIHFSKDACGSFFFACRGEILPLSLPFVRDDRHAFFFRRRLETSPCLRFFDRKWEKETISVFSFAKQERSGGARPRQACRLERKDPCINNEQEKSEKEKQNETSISRKARRRQRDQAPLGRRPPETEEKMPRK